MSFTEPTDRLPPLTALRAFDAAARHMSFAKAAEELHVTPAALSYQIKRLEAHLGQPLFRRLNRAVELTAAGRALQPGVAEGFAAFRAAKRAADRLRADRALVITAGPAFTAKWLAPRMFRFAEAHPEIELRFVASLRIMDFARDEVDAAIRYGVGRDDGLFSRPLFDDRLLPLCAPALAEGLERPGDLARRTLLHDDSLAAFENPPGWPDWLAAAGVELPNASRGPRFSNADHAIDAAIEGGGVALARFMLAERDIAAGRLVAPFPLLIRAPGEYRFVCPRGAETAPAPAAFLAWLEEEALRTETALAAFREDRRAVEPPA